MRQVPLGFPSVYKDEMRKEGLLKLRKVVALKFLQRPVTVIEVDLHFNTAKFLYRRFNQNFTFTNIYNYSINLNQN